MEWNNWNVTPFLLFESTADSEELLLKSDVFHDHQEDEEKEEREVDHMMDDDDDDDAESCSYDHSSYVNTRSSSYVNTRSSSCGNSRNQDQTPDGFIYDDGHDDDDDDDYDGHDDDDDDGEVDDGKISKLMMDGCMAHKFCHQFCGDSLSHERETDRKFWETCLAS